MGFPVGCWGSGTWTPVKMQPGGLFVIRRGRERQSCLGLKAERVCVGVRKSIIMEDVG